MDCLPSSRQPAVEVLLHEVVVDKMRISAADAVDFGGLAGGKILMRIEAPAASEQSLTPQNLVYTGNAAVKSVSRIEQCGVGIRNLLRKSQQICWHWLSA